MPLPLPQPNSFVIFRDAKRIKQLLQVSSVDATTGVIVGHLDKNRAYKPLQQQFHIKDMMANLGPNPENGSVYGVNIEPYRRTLRHDQWGDIHIYTHLTKEQWIAIKGGLSRAYADLKKRRLHTLIEAANLSIEVRPPKGKNLGKYLYRQKGDQAADIFLIRVYNDPNKDVPDLFRELTHHEMGHGLTFRGMTRKMRARWIRLYEEFCTFTEHTPQDVQKMGKRFVSSLQTVKDFRATLESDEESILFDSCLAQIAADYRLNARDIDALADGEERELVKQMWPTQALRYSDFEEALGQYATTKWEEFTAEAFRLYYTKTEIPQRIRALLEQSIKMAPTIIGGQG